MSRVLTEFRVLPKDDPVPGGSPPRIYRLRKFKRDELEGAKSRVALYLLEHLDKLNKLGEPDADVEFHSKLWEEDGHHRLVSYL